MVVVKNLTVLSDFDKTPLLLNISCALQEGSITSFIGQSGAGKTTLLKAMIGLIDSKEGLITVDNYILSTCTFFERSKKIGYVFQDFNLFNHMTVLENCINPQLIHNVLEIDAHKRAIGLLKDLDIEHLKNRYPKELSGGQKQRVAIVRALCLEPKVLLLDEPTASLDPINTDILVKILKRLAKKGFTIGLSTQDMNFINKVFDKVYLLNKGEVIEFCDGEKKRAASFKINNFLDTTR